MSIDVDWSALDAQLTLSCTRFLSQAFAQAPTPDFVGPLAVTHFSFGDALPQVTLDDIRDIQHEFLQPQDLDPGSQVDDDDDEGDDDAAHHHHLAIPSTDDRVAAWHHHHHRPWGGSLPLPRSRSHSPHAAPPSHSHPTHPHSYSPPSPTPTHSSLPPLHTPQPSSAPSPSFQLHLRVSYAGNLSLGVLTALRINYPSPGFMSLPLALTLTGLALEGTLVVAYEGGSRRVHVSLLEPPPSDDDDGAQGDSPTKPRGPGLLGAAGSRAHAASTTAGASRVLRAAHVESEVGQADRHVLRNVGKVEKFVVDVARRTLDNELVFPNFQTIMF